MGVVLVRHGLERSTGLEYRHGLVSMPGLGFRYGLEFRRVFYYLIHFIILSFSSFTILFFSFCND